MPASPEGRSALLAGVFGVLGLPRPVVACRLVRRAVR